MPGSKTFASGDVLTAADMNAYARGGLVMAWASVLTPQTTITTVTDLTGLTVTFTAIAGRLYRTTFIGEVNGTVAGDLLAVYITNGANTVLQRGVITVPALSSGVGYSQITLQHYWTGSGSTTHKVRLERNAGTGNANLYAGTDGPAVIVVEDIGVA